MEELTGLALEERMIQYAITSDSKAYDVYGWKIFKLKYECPRTAVELFNLFWNDIMPNIHNYDVDEHHVNCLNLIPNPMKIPEKMNKRKQVINWTYRCTHESREIGWMLNASYFSYLRGKYVLSFEKITFKPLGIALKEEIEERERDRFKDPTVLKIKDTFAEFLNKHYIRARSERQPSETTETRGREWK